MDLPARDLCQIEDGNLSEANEVWPASVVSVRVNLGLWLSYGWDQTERKRASLPVIFAKSKRSELAAAHAWIPNRELGLGYS